MNKTINNVTIECVKGDITNQKDIDAIVNAANAQLMTGGGVAGAIHKAAGAGLEEECRPLAPIQPGEAVITSGQELHNKYIIHCLGPVYGQDHPEEELLKACYRNALSLAEEHNIKSIAFPAISTGVFGYPIEDAARIAINTIVEITSELSSVKTIRFVLHTDSDLSIHEKELE